jgi:fimbrial chaperone protein
VLHAKALAAVTVAVVTVAAGPCMGGALQVSPIGFDLPAGKAAAVLTVRNDDDAPMNIQVRVFRWSQSDGQDQYTSTDEVVASPPITALAPHSERLIRIVRLAPPAQTEQSYRLVVDELPPPPSAQAGRVQMLLRHSIPLFFAAPGESKPAIDWAAAPTDGGVLVEAHNGGGRHVRISNLRLLDGAGGTVMRRDGLVGYVLADSGVRWTLPGAVANPISLHADGDAGAIDATLRSRP